MADPLRFHPLVASDLRDAVGWYDEISTELGNRFRELVDTRFDDIAGNAERFGVAYDDVRFARVKSFPYVILFRRQGDMVVVLGVFHSASDPEKWRRRSSQQ